MASGVGYFGDGVFASNYWNGAYWAPSGSLAGDYWPGNYWNANYWNTNYWLETTTGPGDIFVTDDATLTLTSFVSAVTTGPEVLAGTATLDFTVFPADANLDIDPAVTTAALTLTSFDVGIGTSGYVLGDIPLTFSPESTITITFGMLPGTGDLTLTGHHPTTNTENGLDVGVGTPTGLSLESFPTLAANQVDVQPVPAVLTLTAFDSPAAGIGELIRVTLPSMTFAEPTHTIVGTPAVTATNPTPIAMSLSFFDPQVFGVTPIQIPDGTFEGDDSIVNTFAAPYPSNYEICDRTGFRLKRGQLVEEWNGLKVRPESWERRQPQDFVRGVSDDQTGSPRPEQVDTFVSDRYPNGVTADDL